jgi:hypothetical protein
LKHRDGNIVVYNLIKNPQDHPGIEIKEYAENPKCWIVRVEDMSEAVLAGRRAKLAGKAKNKWVQRGRNAGGKGKGKRKK